MLRRRTMGQRKLIEVTEVILSTKSWIVPAGCKNVDAFIVAAGGRGGYSDIRQPVGYAGRGGTVLLQKDIPVVPGSSVNIIVGKSDGESSSFGSIIAQGANEPGESGKSGIACPFDVPLAYSYKMGAHGGKGLPYPSSVTQNLGGDRGGGDGASAQNDPNGGAKSGSPGWYYGAGGGGASQGGYWNSIAPGGIGYQGIVILHYWKYKSV